MLQDIENKLHVIRVEINNSDFDRAGGDGLVTVPGPNQRKTSISEKIDCLAELLGLTLYGAKWRCPPRTQSRPQIGPDGLHVPDPQTGHRGQSVTPPRSIKDELHAIEICLEEIKEEIGRPPPEEPPEDPLIAVDLKHIFVYAQDVFTPSAATPSVTIEVRTAAFDWPSPSFVDTNFTLIS